MRRFFVLLLVASACGSAPEERHARVVHASPDLTPGATVAEPLVSAVFPAQAAAAHPDVVVKVVFSAPMAADETTRAFVLLCGGASIEGEAHWDVSTSVLAFTPSQLLSATHCDVLVGDDARSASGEPLATPFESGFEVHISTDSKG